MKSRKGQNLKNPVSFIFAILCFSGAFILFVSVLKLPESAVVGPFRAKVERRRLPSDEGIGKLGKMVIEMLPEDLGFTVLLPSEKAFERDLGLRWEESFAGEKMNDSNAMLTRVLGFCAVPSMIYSKDLPRGGVKEVDYDSLDGYTLYMSRDEDDGMVVVNRIRSGEVDLLLKKKILVHVMDGVIMDAEFEQSVMPD